MDKQDYLIDSQIYACIWNDAYDICQKAFEEASGTLYPVQFHSTVNYSGIFASLSKRKPRFQHLYHIQWIKASPLKQSTNKQISINTHLKISFVKNTWG